MRGMGYAWDVCRQAIYDSYHLCLWKEGSKISPGLRCTPFKDAHDKERVGAVR